LSAGKQDSPSRTIGNQEKYYDSYDFTIPLQHGQCGLRLQTHALPYVEEYYVIFEDYERDDQGMSLLADKDIMMNFGDVLLAVDGLDVEGMKLPEIMNILKGKQTNIVTLTFLNKEWFNNYDRDSVKTGTIIQKKGKYYTVFWITDNLLI
jgi:C-terminal processing protease CtpA/Prc